MTRKEAERLAKPTIIAMLRTWIRQRPGLEFGNYGDIAPYRAELRQIAKDKRDAETLLRAVEWRDSITAEDLLAAFPRAFSGRLRLEQRKDGKWVLDYCTGQYWPTEYRKAAAAVLATVLWDRARADMPAPSAYMVDCRDDDGNYTRATSRNFSDKLTAKAYADTIAQDRIAAVHELYDGMRSGDWIRRHFRREFGRSIQSRWFN